MSYLDDFTIHDEGDQIKTPGIDFGPKGLQVIARHGNYVVVRQPGHSGWSSRGQTSYYATTYMLLRLQREHIKAGERMNRDAWNRESATKIRDVEPGRKWRAAVAELEAEAKKLAAGSSKSVRE
jgi:hypothetical protein